MILEPPDSVQKLQAALQAKAKGSPGYRFYLLYDKLYRRDVLNYAYRCCKANGGAPGVDQQDFADIAACVDTEIGRPKASARHSLHRRSDGDDGSGGGAYAHLRGRHAGRAACLPR